MLAVQLARLAGAQWVAAVDIVEERLQLASQMGADVTINARLVDPLVELRKETGGSGVDLALELAGNGQTRRQALGALRPGGTAIYLGLGGGEAELNFLPVVNRELNLRGSYGYTDGDFSQAIRLISGRKIRADGWVHAASLVEGVGLFERMAAGSGDWVKVVLVPR